MRSCPKDDSCMAMASVFLVVVKSVVDTPKFEFLVKVIEARVPFLPCCISFYILSRSLSFEFQLVGGVVKPCFASSILLE